MYELSDLTRYIENEEIKVFTILALNLADIQTFKNKSSRNHHPPDERGEWGNYIHTDRVVRVTDLLCRVCKITGIKRDIANSAAAIHDSCKYGVKVIYSYTHPHHPLFVRELVKDLNCQYKERILDAVERHMGQWGEGTPAFVPELTVADMVHISDCICAQGNDIWDLKELTPNG
jgi:hypothetical protein